MLFNSYEFLIFFPIVLLGYYVIPKRFSYLWLLVASYYFYMSWNAKYAILLLVSTTVTWATGLIIDYTDKIHENIRIKRFSLFLCIFINLGILFFFKYHNFFWKSVTGVLNLMGITISVPAFDVLLPVGISFYTFQALGYSIDVYRGDIKAERNLFRYALFVSFFPQLVAGPIERSKNLLHQLEEPKKMTPERCRDGLLIMLWGFFLKIVVADRIAIFVDTVYGDYTKYPGGYLIIATILFAFQIYCDFGGYSTIALGGAKLLGVDLMENFNVPYLSMSCGEFWRRWHISLSSWFRDYVYIPLGGNRKGRIRKYINIIIVFFLSGLWHGANWTYVIWGVINGLYQVVGDVWFNIKKSVRKSSKSVDLEGDDQSVSNLLIKALGTFVLIDFSWIFFRSSSLNESIEVIKSMITEHNPWVLFDGSLYQCGLNEKEIHVLLIALAVVVVSDFLKYYNFSFRNFIYRQNIWFRYVFVLILVFAVVVYGIWGTQYSSGAFIYFQF